MLSNNHANNRLISLFFYNEPAPPDIYTLSLHDALPIWPPADPRATSLHAAWSARGQSPGVNFPAGRSQGRKIDRKSTRLNSSHSQISYAVFCLKKKKQIAIIH